ncbi:MAG: IS21 family transposase [Oligoflexales bacterium]|nr:IS21 family transposase [Oligoflexales bacterium]
MDRQILMSLLSGKGVNQIAGELHIGKARIRRVRRQAEDAGYFYGRPLPKWPELLFPDPVDKRHLKEAPICTTLAPHEEWIKERLRAGWRPISIFEELPIEVAKSSFYRFLFKKDLYKIGKHERSKTRQEIVHRPGEALIIDWGKLIDVIDEETGKKKTLWAFVGVLGYSRYLMVRLVWSNDVKSTLLAIESMLKEIGGVPERITSDNPKCFSLKADIYEPILNPAFIKFSEHYGFFPECLPPARPDLKGKIERQMPYIRRLYEVYQDDWQGIEIAQERINRKIALANERKHGTTLERPIDRLIEEESSFLKELPSLSYTEFSYGESKVRKDSHIRFENKYYSVDEKFVGKEVQVLGTHETIAIYLQGKLIETHKRVTERSLSKSTKPHHLHPWEKSMDNHSVYRDKASQIGPYTEQFITKILGTGCGVIDFRKVWGILSLEKSWSCKQIEEAAKIAIENGKYSYQFMLKLLELGICNKKEEVLTGEIPLEPLEDKIRRETNVFVRDIQEYARLVNIH